MIRKNDGDWFPVSFDYPTHRKTLKLIRILGCETADAYPMRAMCWLREQESLDGTFEDDLEVEQATRWSGDPGKLVSAMREAGFLDGLTYHNWHEKAGRSIRTMFAARARTARKRSANDSRMVQGKKEKEKEKERKNKNTPPFPPPGGEVRPECEEPDGFTAFWEAWPSHKRKMARTQCAARWRSLSLDAASQETILKHLLACRESWDWRKEGGEYIPAPLVYLNQRRWEAAPPGASPPGTESPRSPRQAAEDEMRSVLWGKEE